MLRAKQRQEKMLFSGLTLDAVFDSFCVHLVSHFLQDFKKELNTMERVKNDYVRKTAEQVGTEVLHLYIFSLILS